MAATRLIALHIRSGKNIKQCLKDSTNYILNPEKNEKGEYVSSYECEARTAAEEFLLSHRQYEHITGKKQKRAVVAYQIRQSFKPGEITAEEANRVGYELAMSWTKGKYAFIVSTHVDKAHIHNHIIYNSVSLDCERKFKDFFLSARALQKVSDRICLAHGLSVIEPKSYRERNTQNPYAGKSSQRIKLCQAIERVLEEKPKNFREFVKLLEAEGYAYKSGKHAAFRKSGAKRYIRLDSLPQGYREQEILEKLESTIIEKNEKKKQYRQSENSLSMLIDIQEKLRSGKGAGYERWAKVFNLKQMVNTMEFLKENHLESLEELTERTSEVTEQYHICRDTIRQCDDRLKEIGEMKKQIVSYVKTREIYQRYRKSGHSKKFLEEHREEIAIHMAAKKFFDESGLKKLPKVKELSAEYGEVLEKKREAYKNYRTYQEEMKKYQIAEKTVKTILEKDTEDTRTERETASAER